VPATHCIGDGKTQSVPLGCGVVELKAVEVAGDRRGGGDVGGAVITASGEDTAKKAAVPTR